MPRLQPLKPARLSRSQVSLLMHQLMQALAALHSKGLVHMDIALSNIMLNDSGDVQLIDFGFVLSAGGPSSRHLGTPGFFAPELWKAGDCPPQPSMDIFSAGVCFLHLLKYHLPGGMMDEVIDEDEEVISARLSLAPDWRAVYGALDEWQRSCCTLAALMTDDIPEKRVSASKALDFITDNLFPQSPSSVPSPVVLPLTTTEELPAHPAGTPTLESRRLPSTTQEPKSPLPQPSPLCKSPASAPNSCF